MDARFYNSEEIDIERLAKDLVSAYLVQGYQAQEIGNKDQMMVQIKKGGDFEALIGMQAALSLNIQRTSGGVLAMIGQQRWIDKAAVGAVGVVALPFLWPLALTAGVGALRQASLGNQVLNMVDGLVRQQKPNVAVGPVPYHLMPQMQQQWAPPGQQPPPYYTPPQPAAPPPQPTYSAPAPAPAPTMGGLRCSSCNTPYEAGDTFCSGCGKPLSQPRQYCSKCNSEIKNGASFCPRCGSSTFHTVIGNQPVPASPVQSAPKIAYTPSAPPPAPAYTPPPAPKKPETPYYVPSQQQSVPPIQAKPQAPAYTPPTPPAKPVEPAYVPPVTQTPDVMPQPKVTYTQGQSSPPKQGQRSVPPPPKQYYIPSNQAAKQSLDKTTTETTASGQSVPPTIPATPAQPASPSSTGQASEAPAASYYVPSTQAAKDQLQAAQAKQQEQPSTGEVEKAVPWGSLTFSDGQPTVELRGDHAMIGRYNQDLGGLQPEVDLAQADEADTVSRVHAVIERSGNGCTITDLNSTNLTRLNGKKLEPDKDEPLKDGDTLQFGKVSCTFKQL